MICRSKGARGERHEPDDPAEWGRRGCREAARRERLAGEAESSRQLRGGGGRPGSRERAEVLMRERERERERDSEQ
jgi:hypothetical protein